jgi:putative endonuclease
MENRKPDKFEDFPKETTRSRGNKAEEAAAEYLLSKGYRIICRQYRLKMGEIDIVAQDNDGTLAFVEVKSSFSSGFGNPLFRITPSKQKTIAKIARIYLANHKISRVPCRFDVISVINGKIEHLRNAFYV